MLRVKRLGRDDPRPLLRSNACVRNACARGIRGAVDETLVGPSGAPERGEVVASAADDLLTNGGSAESDDAERGLYHR